MVLSIQHKYMIPVRLDKSYIWKYPYLYMKTTIDIADNIMIQSKELARREHVTLRELVEQGLQTILQSNKKDSSGRIKPVTLKGKGLATEFRGASWGQVRKAAYEGRGS